jgi:hypothetical protein
MGMSLVMNGVQMPGGDPTEPGGIFSLGEPEKLRSLVADAGFKEVETEALDLVWDYKDRDEAWMQLSELSGPLSVIVAGLDDEQTSAVRKSYEESLQQYSSGEGYEVPAQALCVSAR